MKAVILVGGEATRLRPLTYHTPKAMIPICNTPLLEHIIYHLKDYEVTDIILAQRRHSQTIRKHFKDGKHMGVRLTYITERFPLGTAGAVKNCKVYLDEAFLVLNGDILTDLNIADLVDFHKKMKAMITLTLTKVENPTSYGLIKFDSQKRVISFIEKPQSTEVTNNMINAGSYILEPDILEYIPDGTSYSFERQLFPTLLKKGVPIYAYSSPAYWIDVGTPENYMKAHHDLIEYEGKKYAIEANCFTGYGNKIHPSIQAYGPVIIGNNCRIGPRVKLIGPVTIGSQCNIQQDTEIEDSIVWDSCQIEPRVKIKNSIISQGCHLKTECVITNRTLLGDHVTVANKMILNGELVLPANLDNPTP